MNPLFQRANERCSEDKENDAAVVIKKEPGMPKESLGSILQKQKAVLHYFHDMATPVPKNRLREHNHPHLEASLTSIPTTHTRSLRHRAHHFNVMLLYPHKSINKSCA